MITLNPTYEKIFTENPVGEDGDIINLFISNEADRIRELLIDGHQLQAATLAMQLIKSNCRHFITDEHWTYFDDLYSPDFTFIHLLNQFKNVHDVGKMDVEVTNYLKAAWTEILNEESYTQYGYPTATLGF